MTLPVKVSIYLEYRTFGRQMQDPDLAFQQMRDDIQMRFPVRATFGDVQQRFWPIAPETVEATEKKGIFTQKNGDETEVILRTLPVTIVCDSIIHAEDSLEDLLTIFPGKFAVAQIVKSYLTDVFAE